MPLVLNIPVSWIAQDSEYISGSEFARVLDIPGFWIYLWFWICQNSKYTRVSNMPGLHRVQNMPGKCLNMPEYAWICLDLPEWLLLYISPFPHLFYNLFSTWALGYLFKRLQETRGYSLKDHEAVFLKRRNLIFSIAAGSISFVFCFRLNISSSKI